MLLPDHTFVYATLGAALVVATVIVHAVGTTWWLRRLSKTYTSGGTHTLRRSVKYLSATVLVLLLLHTIEIELWAAAYLYLLSDAYLPTPEEASYFSFVTFTTLGYGDIVLPPPLRIMSGIEALNGIMLGGWSTALLFAVVQRSWQDMAFTKKSNGEDSNE